MNIPELLAQAVLVDKRCKNHAAKCGMQAQKLAKEAQDCKTATDKRIKEVLANSLNEASGKLRYSPPDAEAQLNEAKNARKG